ncbi:hypothetical protein OUZ56_021651 [Daphnia magna]|uniref:Zinc finger C3HC4 RING-type domain-containing protein n=1 Tax=Daphnia magna TaxID=35525 RepID=A0ABR0AU36_9CRUS|nr:hypothetical protein OUZ56_021651 [Daphnia magna]
MLHDGDMTKKDKSLSASSRNRRTSSYSMFSLNDRSYIINHWMSYISSFDNTRPAKFLACHHRYCSECGDNLLDDELFTIKCPLCRTVTNVSGGHANIDFHVRTDYDFMSLVEHEKLSSC